MAPAQSAPWGTLDRGRLGERVLIADDDEDTRLLVCMFLERLGFSADCRADGHSALDALSSRPCTLAILDIAMPGLDGLQVLDAIRRDPRLSSTPVLLLSAHAQARDVALGLRHGADAYVTKPFTIEHLEHTVRDVLASRTVPEQPRPRRTDHDLGGGRG